ncbi:MAG: NDP-sugar synthase [Dehalococcoidales bacterium]|nr:MAG: NDP-sugar synthase [Dehalococcoidales bacterium]
MKAVILVGGQATRLLPLTYNTPKAMVPVLNTPFLEHVIHHLASHQIKDIVLALGRLAHSIESHLGDGSRFGVSIRYALEKDPLGTAGAVKNAASYVDDTFLVLNGDIFTDLDLSAMIDFHRDRKAKATIALTPVEDPSAYGLIETDARDRVLNFLEKPDKDEITTNMINAGTYVLEPDVLTQIPAGVKCSFEREVFPKLLADGELVCAYTSRAYWIDIGTPPMYLQLHSDLLNGKCRQYDNTPRSEITTGVNSSIHPTARIEGPTVIGANCSIGPGVKISGPVAIGDGCTIQEESVIKKSIIWRNARLEPHARVTMSIIADNCCLRSGCLCEESVLGDNVTVAYDCHLPPGSSIEPGTTVEPA